MCVCVFIVYLSGVTHLFKRLHLDFSLFLILYLKIIEILISILFDHTTYNFVFLPVQEYGLRIYLFLYVCVRLRVITYVLGNRIDVLKTCIYFSVCVCVEGNISFVYFCMGIHLNANLFMYGHFSLYVSLYIYIYISLCVCACVLFVGFFVCMSVIKGRMYSILKDCKTIALLNLFDRNVRLRQHHFPFFLFFSFFVFHLNQ